MIASCEIYLSLEGTKSGSRRLTVFIRIIVVKETMQAVIDKICPIHGKESSLLPRDTIMMCSSGVRYDVRLLVQGLTNRMEDTKLTEGATGACMVRLVVKSLASSGSDVVVEGVCFIVRRAAGSRKLEVTFALLCASIRTCWWAGADRNHQ